MLRINNLAIIQARMGSRRLEGKVLKKIGGKTLIWHIINRLKKIRQIDHIVIATSTSKKDDSLARYCQSLSIDCFRGSEGNVLDRIYRTAQKYKPQNIIRITGDCPFIDYSLTRKLIRLSLQSKADLASIAAGLGASKIIKQYPSGLDTEIFSYNALNKTWNEATSKNDKEHVTTYMWRNDRIFKVVRLIPEVNYNMFRLSVDTKDDLNLVRDIYRYCSKKNVFFTFKDMKNYLDKQLRANLINEFKLLNSQNFKIPDNVDYILVLSGEETDIDGENGERIKYGLQLLKRLKKDKSNIKFIYSGTKTHVNKFLIYLKNNYKHNDTKNIKYQILSDDASTLTQIKYFINICNKSNVKSIIIVTHLYHIPRTKRYIAKFVRNYIKTTFLPINKNMQINKYKQEINKMIEYAYKGDITI